MDMTRLTKKVSLCILRSLAAIFSLSLLMACQDPEPLSQEYESQEHESQVQLASVTASVLEPSQSYSQEQEYSGVIRSANTTDIGFELAGKINDLAVDIGDYVVKGQALAQLDRQLLDNEQQELQAKLKQNKAELDLAKATLRRSANLQQEDHISIQQLDELTSRVAVLRAARAQLNTAYAGNQLRIDKSSILAPFDGIITQKHQDLGAVVAQGAPIYSLVGVNALQAYIGVPVEIAKTLSKGEQVTVRVAEQALPATIEGISAEVAPITRTVELRLALTAASQVLNGEIVYFRHTKQIQEAGYWVPISALIDGIRGRWNIFLLTPNDDKRFKLERRDVDILYIKQDQAYIQGPLQAGLRYVDQGLHKLVADQTVTIGNGNGDASYD